MNSLCGLILAAGLSSRMGESKPLLEWFGQTLIEYQINLFNSLNIKPLVVLGFQSETVISKIKNLDVDIVINEDFKTGKSSSILKGIRNMKSDCDILLLAVDQPRPKIFLEKIMQSHLESKSLITIPKYKYKDSELRGGHPIIIDKSLVDLLSSYINQGKTIKDFIISQNNVNTVFFDDILIRIDLNNKQDYFHALKLFKKYNDYG